MSQKSHIQHRVEMARNGYKLTALERSRKLKSLQVTENKINARKSSLEKQRRELDLEITECFVQLHKVITEKRHIDMAKSPIVTEHALLRYVERFMGIDLNDVHEKILELGDKEVVRAGMTVVTVFPDESDHFNLAEREAE